MRYVLLAATCLMSCQPCEGPIVVYVSDMDDTAIASWAESGSTDFTPCTDGIMEDSFNCGPDDDEAAGTFVVRVEWAGEVFEEEVEVVNDSSCTDNVTVEISGSTSGS